MPTSTGVTVARAARPVNPEDGPIQAFAFDLRALRESAGNPTYRTLAKTAGFSATTLGDAAGGVRLPTLEVTLAYVGACGGEATHWRQRWQAVNRELASQTRGENLRDEDEAAPGKDTEQVEQAEQNKQPELTASSAAEVEAAPQPESQNPASQNPDRPSRRRIRTRVAILGTAAVIVAAAAATPFAIESASSRPATAAALHPTTHTSRNTPPQPCKLTAPVQTAAPALFSGATYGIGANIRTGASLSASVLERVPEGCELSFSGYCLGDLVKDTTAGTPDTRWFMLTTGGEVASAIVHGNPPPGLPPQPCPQDVPDPSSIRLSISAEGSSSGVVALHASGGNLWIVGFAAYYPAGPDDSSAQWHQLSMGTATDPAGFTALLRSASAPAGYPGIPVAAVACFGGDGQSDVAATDMVGRSSGAAPVLRPYQLPPKQRTLAEQVACEYPTGT